MMMMRLNIQTKKIVSEWFHVGWDFLTREWSSVCLWYGYGISAAAMIHLAIHDYFFQGFIISKLSAPTPLDQPERYLPHVFMFFVAILLAIALSIHGFLVRGLRSWLTGVTSGLNFLSFVSGFIPFVLSANNIKVCAVVSLASVGMCLLVSLMLHEISEFRSQRVLSEDALKIPAQIRSLVGTQLSGSDDPIRTWKEDSFGRAIIVESISFKLLISESPVVALFGDFGSGKTSVLNLLRSHLEKKAIVVSFTTWLPGSQETLISYLLGDIATECQRQYIVPGLRKSTRRLAKALAQNVPLLKSYLDSLPAETQKDDIDSFRTALARLPKRVIVLLDELDRMEKAELITLLKVIRGLSTLPKVSFVCAGERKTIAEIVKDGFNDRSNAYFEKFFPTSVLIPKAPLAMLRKVGIQRLVDTFIRRGWLENQSEIDSLRTQLDAIWNERITPFCQTPRAIGSLANDVDAAAFRLKHEVHPIDLILIELLRRFKPAIYEIVGRNPVALTGGESILRGGSLLLEKEKTRLAEQLVKDLKEAVRNEEELKQIKGILDELFPHFQKTNGESVPRRGAPETHEKFGPHVSQPRIFSAYFELELPENVFSHAELRVLLNGMDNATDHRQAELQFLTTFEAMEKGSLLRDDFLAQVAEAAKTVPLLTARSLVKVLMLAAHAYTYDMLAAFGEAGHVLRIVIRVAVRIPTFERFALLEGCIHDATDDTMALNILTRLTGRHDDFDLEVSIAQLHPAFIKRMRMRYGMEVDVVHVDMSTSDPWAFNYWGSISEVEGVTNDPEDRAIQRDFWLRYINGSRSRLADAFRKFFMPPNVNYSGDPTSFVENKLPLLDLRTLDMNLPYEDDLTDMDRQSLRVLRRLINGEFKNGIGPSELYTNEEDDEGFTSGENAAASA
jgi:hypothetical protein